MKFNIRKIEADPFLKEIGLQEDEWRLPYDEILAELSFEHAKRRDFFYELVARLTREDFFLFCLLVLDLPVNHPFLLSRCYELQDNNTVDSLYLWAREHWKALGYDTPVMTSKGWKKHGELKVGDRVVGSDGMFTKVVARTENFENSRQYEITFDKKYKIVASSDHLWKVEKKSKKRIKGTKNKRIGRESCLMTTDEIFDYGCEEDKKLAIEIVPVEYSEKELKLHPYVLGAWLGDGSSADGRIHGIDTEIFDKIKALGYDIRDSSRIETKSIHKIKTVLRNIGVLNNKHIPKEYKYSSIEQRLELVRGLMDTDGTIDKRNRCVFTNINKQLCEDLYEVLVSVGYKPSLNTFISQTKGDNYIFYNVAFAGRKEMNPFYLKRKAESVYVEDKKLYRYITEIKRLRDGENLTNCIQVDSRDGIYLAGKEMIQTHNSTLITYARGLWRLIRKPEASTVILSNSKAIALPHFNFIKNACEKKSMLQNCWPNIFFKNPKRDTKWSEKEGLYFKTTTEKDAGFVSYGLVNDMPTGGHFMYMTIDDLVDLDNIGTHYMMQKILGKYENADNLLSYYKDPVEDIIGTRYKAGDLYEHIINLGTHRVSLIPAVVDKNGNPIEDPAEMAEGVPVFMSMQDLKRKYSKQGFETFCSQMLQQPKSSGRKTFNIQDIRFYEKLPKEKVGMYFIVGDPASNPELAVSKKLDYTCLLLLATGPGRRIYLVDGLRDRISLREKWNKLKEWHENYDITFCGYEEYATQKDRETFLMMMDEERFYFTITPLRGNTKTKRERITGLSPWFADHRIWLPKNLYISTKSDGVVDFVDVFINEEVKDYPNVKFDDILDTFARIYDVPLYFPEEEPEEEERKPVNHGPSPLDETSGSDDCFWGGW